MAALPFIKLYPGDYFADTRHLTCIQHGIYLQLLLTYWLRGDLPDDDAFLARTVGLGPREWQRHRPTIVAFFEVTTGRWFNRRLEHELAGASAKSLKAKDAGRASARGRLSLRPTNAEPVRSQKSEGSTEPSVSTPKGVSPPEEPGAMPLFGGEQPAEQVPDVDPEVRYSAHFEAFYAAFPRRVGKGAAAKAYERAVDRLVGRKAGNAPRAHSKLKASAEAYAVLSGDLETHLIPHPATWLNQNRWDDDAVSDYLSKRADGTNADGGTGIRWGKLGRK